MDLIAASAILLLEAVSAVMALYIVYFIALRWKGEGVEREPLAIDRGFVLGSMAFAAIIGVSLWYAHRYAEAGLVLASALALGAGAIGAGVLYIPYLRAKWDDDRIRYAVLLWVTLWALIVFLLLVAWRWGDRKLDDSTLMQLVNNAAQIIGIVVAAAMIVVTNLVNSKQMNVTAQHKIYQTLELQSVQLFQWECEHPKYVKMLWLDERVPRNDLDRHLLRLYICQTLNLFEMAVRFRRQQIVAPEVFGSWVIWMWEMCALPVFQKLWSGEGGIWSNYVVEFREIMSQGVEISTGRGGDAEKRDKFFAFVGKKLSCTKVENWMNNEALTAKLAR